VWHNGDGTKVEVPAAPQRVVLVDPGPATAGAAATLAGGRVVGIATPARPEGHAPIDAPGGWSELRPARAPTDAAVAELEPDLIVSHAGIAANARLARIAPLALLPEDAGDDWRRGTLLAGDLLGVGADARARLAEADARIAEIRDEVAPATTLTLLEVQRRGIVARPGAYPRPLLDEIGLSAPEILRPAPRGGGCCVPVPIDDLDKVDADYVLVAVDPNRAAERRFARIEDDPRWRSLGSSQRKDLHRVDARAWTEATLPGVETALGDVSTYVLGAQGETG
jgi:ABC-type Fe3+-hydroxamate transport system substrate-binding protein